MTNINCNIQSSLSVFIRWPIRYFIQSTAATVTLVRSCKISSYIYRHENFPWICGFPRFLRSSGSFEISVNLRRNLFFFGLPPSDRTILLWHNRNWIIPYPHQSNGKKHVNQMWNIHYSLVLWPNTVSHCLLLSETGSQAISVYCFAAT